MKVYQIFASIDGEINAFHQGALSVFVRLAGCNLQCKYCDTQYARDPNAGVDMTVDEVIGRIVMYKGIRKVTITGGEPLLQYEEVDRLIRSLQDVEYNVSLETNGTIAPPDISGLSVVIDYKLESSGMMSDMRAINYKRLRFYDVIKFVIGDRRDFELARDISKTFQDHGNPAQIAFSPVIPGVDPVELFEWMKKEPLAYGVLNIQLHKLINLQEPVEVIGKKIL